MEDAIFERGFQLFQLKRYQDAINSLKEGLQREPENYFAKSLLVRCYIELDNFEVAEKLNESLLSQFPNEDELFYNRSAIKWHNKDLAKAIEAIDEAIRLDPYRADYFGYKGMILLESKDYQEGLATANDGLELDPNNVLCLNVRAQTLTKLKRNEEAQETINNTLHQDPEGSFSHANVGWVQLEQGNHVDAMHHFKESLKNDPNSRYAQEGMLEAIKAKNFVYRAYLKYAFWISNMKTQNQWFFIIGIYIVYRFLVKSVQFSQYPYLVFLIIVPYLLFALGGWIIGPLSNMILLFHSYGKYLLDKNDKLSGMIFFSCLLVSILSFGLFFGLGQDVFLLISVSALCAIIPLAKGALKEDKYSKIISFAIGAIIICAGLIGPFFTTDLMFLGTVSLLGLVAYTWIGNFLKN
ncbi:tetratricopeptide repeat protein [Aquimarina sp. D1M17]|uniref:tetratricopeptide repeat protein n=1 Tax=Aquimarina acroporae TaxID=2937283 RepID=UPI0020C03E88|nr:tetratricopeptide repeat protein [Aquimarina acroporae]MCK8522800.1 tetratricopeptide repeat protein [Aquimarina acroporae]